MKTIKSILAMFALTAFMGTTAFAQDNQNQDVDVQKEIETEKGEAEYSYEKEKDNGVEKDAEYYSETDTDNRESETDLEHESEDATGKSSGLTQEELDKKAEKATSGQADVGRQDQKGQKKGDSQYIGSANQQQNKTEIEPEKLPNEVTESITDGEYAAWTISRVYEISPEGQAGTTTDQQRTDRTQDQQNQTQTQQQSETQFGQDADAVVYEIYFLNPDDNQVETQRFDEEGNAR